jgi:vacuolar-type H+-ATPase subunit H
VGCCQGCKRPARSIRQVAARLPLVLSILKKAKIEVEKLDNAAQEELERPLESCKEKAEKLDKFFRKVLSQDDNGRLEKYRKAVSTLVKGKRVEELMEGILRDIQVIANDKLMGTATEEQVKEVADAIKEMKEMPSSLPSEAGSVTQTHSGGGHNIANTGPGNTNNIQSGGSGSFYHNSGPAYFGGEK